MARPRLLLADDREDLLDEVATLLRSDFDVIGVARNGAALVDLAAELNPDAVITDFGMPGLSGIEAGSIVLRRGLCKAVILLTMHADPQLAQRALHAGFLGFVVKASAGEDLIPAIHSALRGVAYVSAFPDHPV